MVRWFLRYMQDGAKKWMEQQQTSILSAAAVLTASVLLSSLTGLLSYRLLASTFYNPETKTQVQLDAYWVAFQPADLVFQLLVAGAFSAAFIPVFTKYKQQNEKEAFSIASSVMTLVVMLFFIVGTAVFIGMPWIVRKMTGIGFSQEQVVLAAQMARLMLFAQLFFAISNFLSGMIQSHQRFIVPALAPVVYNIGIIFGTVVLGRFFGIFGPVYGVLIGAFAHMALHIPLAYKLGFRYRFQILWKHKGVGEIVSLTLPRALSTGIDLLQPYFLTFFITSIAGANLTIMRFAQRLMTIPIRVFGVPIGQASLPFLSKETSTGDYEKFRALLIESLHQVTFFALPASMLLLILRIPLVRFAFGAKNFPWGDTVLTGRVVGVLALSVAAQALTHVLVRGFYALHDTRRPFFVSIFSMMVSVVFGWMVTYTFVGTAAEKLVWFAVATSLVGFLETFLLFLLLHLRMRFALSRILVPQFKMVCAAALMAVALYFPMNKLDNVVFDTTRTVGLLLLTGSVSTVGMIVYILFAWIFRVEELYMLKKIWGKMGMWRGALAKSSEPIAQETSQGMGT